MAETPCMMKTFAISISLLKVQGSCRETQVPAEKRTPSPGKYSFAEAPGEEGQALPATGCKARASTLSTPTPGGEVGCKSLIGEAKGAGAAGGVVPFEPDDDDRRDKAREGTGEGGVYRSVQSGF